MVAVGDAETEPETALAVAKFVPVQEVALVEDHVRVEDWPEVMVVGLAVSVAVGVAGGGTGDTPTVTLLVAVPPAPEQLTLYVVVAVGDAETEPEIALPVEKFVPVQDVAFVELQVKVVALPETTEVGFADKDAVGVAGGAGVTETVAEADFEPPAPVQETV